MTEREIFLAALKIEDCTAREAYVRTACGDDRELLTRVESLLTLNESGSASLETPVVEQVTDEGGVSLAQTVMYEKGSTEDQELDQLDHLDPKGLARERTEPMHVDDGREELLGHLLPSTKPGSLGRLGHYDIQQVLGRGAFGIVLKALDEKLQRVVAIKLLAPEMASSSPARKRFLREARSAAAVRHEHVVNIYAVEEEPIPYLVMEYIPGQTLARRLEQSGPLDVATVVRLGREISEGLAAAHAQDLIHRDIKPGNILLESGVIERVKITDFGLARAADDASVSQSGLIAGTPMYMAPEQAQGHKLDQRADLFSLGSVLYLMVSGRPPFRANGTVAVLKRVVEEDPRPIIEIIPETPDWLCAIIVKLHAKDPADRFQSATEVAEIFATCEAKLKSNQAVTICIPLVNQPSRMPWKLSASLVIAPLLVLAITESFGVTHLWHKARPTVPDIGTASGTTTDSDDGDETSPDSKSPKQVVVDVVPVAVPQTEPLPPTFKNSIGMEFVIVPKGKSWLGGGKNRFGKQEVKFANDFYLGKFEVTQDQWLQVMGVNPSSCHDGSLAELPVESMSWDAAQEFVAKLNQREANTGWTYRLPTDVEWEYACRGGSMKDRSQSRYDFYLAKPTNEILPTQANFHEETTTIVGEYEPNALGLYDMHGNVHEWCADPVEGPYGRLFRAHRGGCWRYGPSEGLAAKKGWFPANGASRHLGLRLARVPVPPPTSDSVKPRAPFTDEDVRRIAALPVQQRAAAVVSELKARHPGLDGTSKHTIESGQVTEFTFLPNDGRIPVSDLTPLKALPDLKSLYLWNVSGVASLDVLKGLHLKSLVLGGHEIQNPVSSLEPLRDMPLNHLRLYQCAIHDLEPLRGMPLEMLALDHCAQVRDLAPLEGMPLTDVSIGNTAIRNLEVFRDMPLKFLAVHQTGVTDLTPLAGLELEQFLFTPKSITNGVEVLRAMTSLKQIGIDYENYTNPTDFWTRYDKGEFTQ